ncbi:MAG: hypothetical protein M1834_001370 [Cirrosporium novae-zelandiae]|nr:MAG: hypothetical protein M1834_001370 [Cirrosporium novae-zelandiae]
MSAFSPPNSQYPTSNPLGDPYSNLSTNVIPKQENPDVKTTTTTTTTTQPPAAPQAHESKGRLRKACDSCSIRKVKCDESGPPCKACAALDIPCTFERPSRRRGPPNRHAEAIRRQKLKSPGLGESASPSSPTTATAQALASLSQSRSLTVESICPLPALYLLIEDFFTYIHPLVPIPHEPTFRAALARRDDTHDLKFLALVAAMLAALVASFPRKPHSRMKILRAKISNSIEMVEKCHRIALEARGVGYLDKELNVYDVATSYFLALAGGYVFNWRRCRLYFAEGIAIARTLGLYKLGNFHDSAGSSPSDCSMMERRTDYIAQEIGKRLVWVIFVGVRSLHQWGAQFQEIVLPPRTPTDPYPPLPLEVDDAYIFSTHVEPQPPGLISELCGFNANVRVFSTYDALASVELLHGIDQVFDWDQQKRILYQCLTSAKQVLNIIPKQLTLQPRASGSSWGDSSDPSKANTPPGLGMGPGINESSGGAIPPEERRRVMYEIQKANIYVSQLGTRSYLVEKFFSLYENLPHHLRQGMNSPTLVAAGLERRLTPNIPDACERLMASEREDVVRDLLIVLSSISPVDMEPNGGSFTFKVRQIASTLLDVPRTRKGEFAQKVELYLKAFVDILMKLEHSCTANGDDDGEESELRRWADLREYQKQFLQEGGFASLG